MNPLKAYVTELDQVFDQAGEVALRVPTLNLQRFFNGFGAQCKCSSRYAASIDSSPHPVQFRNETSDLQAIEYRYPYGVYVSKHRI